MMKECIQTRLCHKPTGGFEIIARKGDMTTGYVPLRGLSLEENHIAAALALSSLLGLPEEFRTGKLPDGSFAHLHED